MKVVTIVGARPQFIKAAVVSRTLRKKHSEILIHTGQHYDYNMSDIFFEELEIPLPDYNLGISGGSHGKMTGEMLIGIERLLLKETPDKVLLYGDTNSTLAGALAAAKLGIPICHVEAGNRLGTLSNPEEINRILTDHVSSVLCCCTSSAFEFLKKENLAEKAIITGDPMYDAFLFYSEKIGETVPETLTDLAGATIELPKNFYYLTCHRQENTKDPETLKEILTAMNSLDAPCIYPVHPRNHNMIQELIKTYSFSNIIFINPVGYLMSIYLVNHAKKIVTDSGGLQREAYFAKKQCITVFDYIVWPETMTQNRNQLAKPLEKEILQKLNEKIDFTNMDYPFGDGYSAIKIVEAIEKVTLQ